MTAFMTAPMSFMVGDPNSRMTVSIGVLSLAAVVAAIVFALTRGAGEAEAHGDGVTVPGKPQLGQIQVTGPTTMTVSGWAARSTWKASRSSHSVAT